MRRIALLILTATACQAQVTQQTLPSRVEALQTLPERLEREAVSAATPEAQPQRRSPRTRPPSTAKTSASPPGRLHLPLLSLRVSDFLALPAEMGAAAPVTQADAAPEPMAAHAPSEDHSVSVQTAGFHAYEAGRYAEAVALFEAQPDSLDASGWEVLGWSHWQLGQPRLALAAFSRAYRLLSTDGAARGLVLAAHASGEYARLLEALQQEHSGPLHALVGEAVRQAILNGATDFQLDPEGRLRLAEAATPAATSWEHTARLETRHKRGTAGEGRLQQAGLTLIAARGRDTGTWRLELSTRHSDDGLEHAQGWAAGVGWQQVGANGLQHDLYLGRGLDGGVLPATWVGSYQLSRGDALRGWSLSLYRRQNQESLLALAGKQLGGLRWGRVLEHALRIDRYGRWGAWQPLASLTYARLTGVGVEDNDQVSLYARMLRPVSGTAGLSLGPEFYTTAFRRDLEGYGPGQGGYFSPALHAKLGGLLRIERTDSPWQWQASLGLGWALTQRDTSADDQGLAGQLELDATRDLGAGWRLGLRMSGRHSSDYRDLHAGLMLHRAY